MSTLTPARACTPLSPLFGCTLDELADVYVGWSPGRLWASAVVYYALVIAPVVVMAGELPVVRALAKSVCVAQRKTPTLALVAPEPRGEVVSRRGEHGRRSPRTGPCPCVRLG